MKKLVTDVKEGDVIQCPHVKSYWGKVYSIEQTDKKITFFIVYTEGEMLGTKWHYNFYKTSKVIVK